jgi:hypothetical protein
MKREKQKKPFWFLLWLHHHFDKHNTTNKNIRIQEPLDSKWGKKTHLQKIEVNKKLKCQFAFFYSLLWLPKFS